MQRGRCRVLPDVVRHREGVIGAGPRDRKVIREPFSRSMEGMTRVAAVRNSAREPRADSTVPSWSRAGDQQDCADDEGDLHPVAGQLADELLVGVRLGACLPERAEPVDVVLSTIRDGDLSIRRDPVLDAQVGLPVGLGHDLAGRVGPPLEGLVHEDADQPEVPDGEQGDEGIEQQEGPAQDGKEGELPPR